MFKTPALGLPAVHVYLRSKGDGRIEGRERWAEIRTVCTAIREAWASKGQAAPLSGLRNLWRTRFAVGMWEEEESSKEQGQANWDSRIKWRSLSSCYIPLRTPKILKQACSPEFPASFSSQPLHWPTLHHCWMLSLEEAWWCWAQDWTFEWFPPPVVRQGHQAQSIPSKLGHLSLRPLCKMATTATYFMGMLYGDTGEASCKSVHMLEWALWKCYSNNSASSWSVNWSVLAHTSWLRGEQSDSK